MKGSDEQLPNGVYYLVPLQWWQIYNEITPTQSQYSNQQNVFQSFLKPLNLYINTFLIDFKEHIKRQIKIKTKIKQFDSLFLSPQIKTNKRWKIVNHEIWNQIYSLTNQQTKIVILYNKEKPFQYFTNQLVRIQLIFSSQYKCDLFIGFFPLNQNMAIIAQQIGKMLGFSNFVNSIILYSQVSLPEDLGFQYLQVLTAREAKQSPIQIKNLYHQSQYRNLQIQGQTEFRENHKHDFIFFQAEEQIQNQRRSISTRMDTPRIYQIQQNGQISRIKKIIQSNKHPQQIQSLREKAQIIMNGNKIQIPTSLTNQNYGIVLEELAKTCLSRIIKRD